MKRNLTKLNAALCLILAYSAVWAETGNLFHVNASGTPANINITLCLNAKAKISCQTYAVSATTLSITPAINNHVYPYAGILVNTPGYSAGDGLQCTMLVNGYCLFQTSSSSPASITLQSSSSSKIATFLYAANYDSQYITSCALDPTSGLITSCQDSANITDYAMGIALNNASNMAYILNYSTGGVVQCSVDPITGVFPNSCPTTTILSPSYTASEYGNIALNPANTFAFLSNSVSSGSLIACPITAGVMSGTCSDTGAGGLSYPSQVAFNSAGTTAYIGQDETGGLTVCSVSGASFSNCIKKLGDGGSVSFDYPAGVALNNTGSVLYVADDSNNKVYGCSTTANNSPYFASCFTAASIPDAWAIVINPQGTVAYVSDYGFITYACPIQLDGTFSTCTAQSSGFDDVTGLALGYSQSSG